MREIVAMLGWLTPLYLVCALCQSAYEIKLLYSLKISSLAVLADDSILHDNLELGCHL